VSRSRDDSLDRLSSAQSSKNDVRGLAAELERQLLAGCREHAGSLADPVEPVKAILSTSDLTSAAPAPGGDDVTNPEAARAWRRHVAEEQRGEGVVSAGFSTTCSGGSAARSSREHQQREVPG